MWIRLVLQQWVSTFGSICHVAIDLAFNLHCLIPQRGLKAIGALVTYLIRNQHLLKIKTQGNSWILKYRLFVRIYTKWMFTSSLFKLGCFIDRIKTLARILEGLLSSINWLFKYVDYNKREISASCYCAQSLLDVSYCTRWITLIVVNRF